MLKMMHLTVFNIMQLTILHYSAKIYQHIFRIPNFCNHTYSIADTFCNNIQQNINTPIKTKLNLHY
jgi:hypothetical protein